MKTQFYTKDFFFFLSQLFQVDTEEKKKYQIKFFLHQIVVLETYLRNNVQTLEWDELFRGGMTACAYEIFIGNNICWGR